MAGVRESTDERQPAFLHDDRAEERGPAFDQQRADWCEHADCQFEKTPASPAYSFDHGRHPSMGTIDTLRNPGRTSPVEEAKTGLLTRALDALTVKARMGPAAAWLTVACLAVMPAATALAQGAPDVARIGARITSPASAPTLAGILYALDSAGDPVTGLRPDSLQATVDDRPVPLSLVPGRPSIALA